MTMSPANPRAWGNGGVTMPPRANNSPVNERRVGFSLYIQQATLNLM
nr:hypothetical protein [Halomonas sp.]